MMEFYIKDMTCRIWHIKYIKGPMIIKKHKKTRTGVAGEYSGNTGVFLIATGFDSVSASAAATEWNTVVAF